MSNIIHNNGVLHTDNGGLVNHICTHCDGRGFHWRRTGAIMDHARTHVKADLYETGDMCVKCFGTGYEVRPQMSLKSLASGFALCCLGLALIWLLLAIFNH